MAKYYLMNGKKRQGPFTEEELIEKGLTPDSMVKRKDAPKWKKASEVSALAKYFPPANPYQQNPYGQQYHQSYYQLNGDNNFCGKRPALSFADAIEICLDDKYSDFSGRARRSEFWNFVLIMLYLQIIPLIGPLYCLIPMIAVTVRRLHDTNHSGWLLYIILLLLIISFAIIFYCIFGGSNRIVIMIFVASGYIFVPLFILLIVFCCLDSDKHENKYGPSPKYQ